MANEREKFGKSKAPIVGTKILARPLPYFIGQGIPASTLMIIDENKGTFQSAQVYDKGAGYQLGRNYDATTLVHVGPSAEKVKEWEAKGYKPTTETFDGCIDLVEVEAKAEAKAEVGADA